MKSGWSYYRDIDGSEVKHAPKTLIGNVYVQEAETDGLQGILDSKLPNTADVIQATHIAASAVTEGKLANGAVTADKIADGAIRDKHIPAGQISPTKIANLAQTILTTVQNTLAQVTSGDAANNELYRQVVLSIKTAIEHAGVEGSAEEALREQILIVIKDALQNAESITTNELKAQIAQVVAAEIDKVTAGGVDAQHLYARIIEAVAAEIGKVTAELVETNELYAQIIRASTAELGKVTAGTAYSNELYTEIMKAVSAEIDRLTAGSASVSDLYASIISAVKAEIDKVNAGTVETNALYAALAQASQAQIGHADIDFAKIKDLAAGTAIIQQGTGGELYITKLKVTDANLVSLTTGELIVKGGDGRFYGLTVDGEGNVTTVLKEVTGDDVADGTLTGGNLIENAITARELNVEQIFADSALIRAVKAANIDVSDLFASSGFVGALQTHLISSDYLKTMVTGMINGRVAVSDVEPESPALGQVWLDLSEGRQVMKRWDGSQWVEVLDASSITQSQKEIRLEVGALSKLAAAFYVDSSGAHVRTVDADGSRQRNGVDINDGVDIIDAGNTIVARFAQGMTFVPVLNVTQRQLIGGYQWQSMKDGSISLDWMGVN